MKRQASIAITIHFRQRRGHPQSAIERKRRAWSESEDDEPVQRPVQPSADDGQM
uniref:Uncharacterized protein n=1 Tax=Oryza brachyantha TaxID=4533 RepID=J3LCI4_ORYBR